MYPIVFIIVHLKTLILLYILTTQAHCAFNSQLTIGQKVRWILGQMFVPFASIFYAVIYFRSYIAKVTALAMPIIVVILLLNGGTEKASIYIMQHLFANMEREIKNLPNSDRKTELAENYRIIRSEMEPSSDRKIGDADAQLLSLMDAVIEDGLPDQDFQTWRSIFYYRRTLTANYIETMANAIRKSHRKKS